MARIKDDEVLIEHAELGTTSVVKKTSVEAWERAGWSVAKTDAKKDTKSKTAAAGNGG